MEWPQMLYIFESSFIGYLNWVDLIDFTFSKLYVKCLYASFSNHDSANLSNEFISCDPIMYPINLRDTDKEDKTHIYLKNLMWTRPNGQCIIHQHHRE